MKLFQTITLWTAVQADNKRRLQMRFLIPFIAVGAFVVGQVQAAPVLFTDQTAWEAAVGTPNLTEDFTGVAANHNLATPFDFGPFTLQAFEADGPESGLNAAGDFALFAVESGGDNPETVVATFDFPITAIGLEMLITNSNNVNREVVVTSSDGPISYFLPAATDTLEFRGITFMSPVTQLTFSSPTSGAGHKVFQIDAVVVPEPATLSVLAPLLGGLAFLRRSRSARS